MIEPGGSFVVRFTPPRTGTFIYHTHLHDERQLPLGLYGPMIVVDAGADVRSGDRSRADGRPQRTRSRRRRTCSIPATPVVMNGETAPVFVWKAGTRHRVRLINITPDDIFSVSLQTPQGPVHVDAGDQGRRAAAGRRSRQPRRRGRRSPSARPTTSRSTPPGRRTLWLEVRSTGGKWQAQGQVIVAK